MSRPQLFWLMGIVLGTFLVSLASLPSLPERSPIHWNIHGEVDGYGSPYEIAFALPVVLTLTTGFLVTLPMIKALRTSLERSGDMYGRMLIAVTLMLAAMQLLILLNALGKPVDVPVILTFMLGIVFMVLGNWMGKIRRNGLMGIRTPWTLASDVVWERTHRIGGRLFVVLGLATSVAALFTKGQMVPLVIFFAGIMGVTGWAFIYSWRVYQSLPSKSETM